jgi:hypothetical protein
MKNRLRLIINLSILTGIQIIVVLVFSYYINNFSSSIEDYLITFFSAQYVNYFILFSVILIQFKSMQSKVNKFNIHQVLIIIYCLIFFSN